MSFRAKREIYAAGPVILDLIQNPQGGATAVIPASLTVIPAKAGTHRAGDANMTAAAAVIADLIQNPQGGDANMTAAAAVIADLIRNPEVLCRDRHSEQSEESPLSLDGRGIKGEGDRRISPRLDSGSSPE